MLEWCFCLTQKTENTKSMKCNFDEILKSDRQNTSRKQLLVIICTGISWVRHLKLLLILFAVCLLVWAHWDTCVEDWLAFKCHPLCKCDKCKPLRWACVSRNPLLLLLHEIKENGLCAREHHRPLCFEAGNLSSSIYPEHHPQIGCRRLQRREWRKLLVPETPRQTEAEAGSEWFVRGGGPTLRPPPGASRNTPPSRGSARGSGVMACSPTSCPALADRVAAGTVGSDYEYKKLPRQPQSRPPPPTTTTTMPITHLLPSIL